MEQVLTKLIPMNLLFYEIYKIYSSRGGKISAPGDNVVRSDLDNQSTSNLPFRQLWK